MAGEKCHWPICLVKFPQRWICGAWQWELSLCGDSTQSVVHWQSVLTIREKRKYDTNVLINLFSIRHSQGQSTLEPVRGKMENEGRKKKMNSEDINTAVNISIIHIHFKALQHNKAVPISHLNSEQYLALYYVDKMPFSIWWDTERIICLLVFVQLHRIIGLRRYSPLASPGMGGYLTEVSCRNLGNVKNRHYSNQISTAAIDKKLIYFSFWPRDFLFVIRNPSWLMQTDRQTDRSLAVKAIVLLCKKHRPIYLVLELHLLSGLFPLWVPYSAPKRHSPVLSSVLLFFCFVWCICIG